METIYKIKVDRDNFRDALEGLLEEYLQYVDNACHYESYKEDDDDCEQLCPYCYAKHLLAESYKI